MKKTNKQKGITLVALVITIIILLILAGISIASLTQTGLFGKAQQAQKESENAQEEENAILENYLAQINEITGEKSDGPKVKIDGTEVTLTKENFGDYLGKQVTNYTGQSSVTIRSSNYIVSPTYRLYYVDFDEKYGDEIGTIYLKAECTSNNYALPKTDTSLATADGIKIDELNPSLYASGVTSPTASGANMKAVTWLTNTTNWASLADTTHSSMSSKINYIVGSPSLEMMMDSYNAHYGLTGESPYIGSLSSTSDRVKLFYKYTSGGCGYKVGPSNNSDASKGYYNWTSAYSVKTDPNIDTMYYPGSANNYWLASPSAAVGTNVLYVGNFAHGYVSANQYDSDYALCPLVSLKSDVLLELQ